MSPQSLIQAKIEPGYYRLQASDTHIGYLQVISVEPPDNWQHGYDEGYDDGFEAGILFQKEQEK